VDEAHLQGVGLLDPRYQRALLVWGAFDRAALKMRLGHTKSLAHYAAAVARRHATHTVPGTETDWPGRQADTEFNTREYLANLETLAAHFGELADVAWKAGQVAESREVRIAKERLERKLAQKRAKFGLTAGAQEAR
jgi:hypothetical protein